MAHATRSKTKNETSIPGPPAIAVGSVFSCTAESPKDFCFAVVTDIYVGGHIRLREIGTVQRRHFPSSDCVVFLPEPSHQLIAGGRTWTILEEEHPEIFGDVYPADGGNWFMQHIYGDWGGQCADDLMY